MDAFTGFKTAAAETVLDVVAAMGSFHTVALAGDALDWLSHSRTRYGILLAEAYCRRK